MLYDRLKHRGLQSLARVRPSQRAIPPGGVLAELLGKARGGTTLRDMGMSNMRLASEAGRKRQRQTLKDMRRDARYAIPLTIGDVALQGYGAKRELDMEKLRSKQNQDIIKGLDETKGMWERHLDIIEEMFEDRGGRYNAITLWNE